LDRQQNESLTFAKNNVTGKSLYITIFTFSHMLYLISLIRVSFSSVAMARGSEKTSQNAQTSCLSFLNNVYFEHYWTTVLVSCRTDVHTIIFLPWFVIVEQDRLWWA